MQQPREFVLFYQSAVYAMKDFILLVSLTSLYAITFGQKGMRESIQPIKATLLRKDKQNGQRRFNKHTHNSHVCSNQAWVAAHL